MTMRTDDSPSVQSPSALSPPVFNSGNVIRATKRILVTGACGFIGSHLVDRLMTDSDNEIIAVDNCFSGDKRNLEQWFGHPRFEFIRHDVCLPLTLEVDEIYHLACPASPVFYQHNPIKTVKTAFQGTLNMCGLAKRVKARVLLASTSEVYGDPLVHPQVESYWGNVNPIGIRSCYDEGKRVAETIAFEYLRLHGTEIRVARIFNTYGPRMLENDGRVVSNFIVQAIRGQSLTVYGDGSQSRSFCYVTDLVDGLMRLMAGSDCGPINLGNPSEYTIRELAERVQATVNPSAKVTFQELPSDDPTRRKPDITRAIDSLGWQPVVPLEVGLALTIEDFKKRIAASKLSKESKLLKEMEAQI